MAGGSRPSFRSRRIVGIDPSPCTFATESRSRKGTFETATSYLLERFCAVRGTYRTSARGGSSSLRETMITGRVLAANPRSASQTSPGYGFIQHPQHVFFARSRAHQVEYILIGDLDNFGNLFAIFIQFTVAIRRYIRRYLSAYGGNFLDQIPCCIYSIGCLVA